MTTVKIDGLRELEAALRDLPNAVGKGVLRTVLRKRAKPIADSYKASVRFDSGTLRDKSGVSTKLSRRQRQLHRRQGSRGAVEVFAGAPAVPQAITEEFGTPDQAPQGALRGAWDAHKHGLVDGIGGDLWTALEKAAARHARRMARLAAKG